MSERNAAVRAAGRQRRELRRVGHHAIPRIQFDRQQPVAERDNLRIWILPQYRGSKKRSDIDAPNRRGRTASNSGNRRLHRAGHVGQHVNLARNRRHVLERNFHRVLQSLLHNNWYQLVCIRVRDHELIRKRPRLRDRRSIPQPGRNDLCDLYLRVAVRRFVTEYSVPCERVEIHPRGLPRRIVRDFDPV